MLPLALDGPILKIKIDATNGLEWAHYTFIYKNNVFALHSLIK
jgi:hypothetical protein